MAIWWTKNKMGWTDKTVVSGALDVKHIFPTLVKNSQRPEIVDAARQELTSGRRA